MTLERVAGSLGVQAQRRSAHHPAMESVTRVPREDDHETTAEVRARLGDMVVGYFLRAISSLGDLPKGPSLAVRGVWVEDPAQLRSGPVPRKDLPEAH